MSNELLNDLRLRILEYKEISGKSQVWVETYSSTQSPFQKLNLGNSSRKTRKSRYQTFLDLSSFTGFLYFVPNILSRIVGPVNLSTIESFHMKKFYLSSIITILTCTGHSSFGSLLLIVICNLVNKDVVELA